MAHLASAAASTPRTSGWGASISDDGALRLRAASRCASRRTNVPRGVFASHPSRSRKAAKRKVPKVTKMDVVTKLQMWGVDVDRMRGETRLPDPRASSRSSTEEPGSATTDPSTGSPPFEPREPDASDSGDRASAPASTSSSSRAVEFSSSSRARRPRTGPRWARTSSFPRASHHLGERSVRGARRRPLPVPREAHPRQARAPRRA